MAWLSPSQHFDVDQLSQPLVGIASRLVQHDSGWHSHGRGQLLFSVAGSIRINLLNATSILPPILVAWIPSATVHQVTIRSEVEYRSIYLDETQITPPFTGMAIVAMSPLLREVFERISWQPFDTDWSQGAARNLLAVCLDELATAQHEPMLLSVPSDPRLAQLDIEHLPPELEVLSRRVGATTRTISRIFRRETGMSYQMWRQSWRLLRAVDLLVAGERISQVAFELGFSSDSAFIAFFRQMTGTTPRRYLLRIAGENGW